MNTLAAYNQAIAYIEDHLTGQVDMEQVARVSLCPQGLFPRHFSVLANMTLSDYIRNRRLSEAAFDLRDNQRKVIDTALMYGYESADAFTVAFKRFHGVSPSQVRDGAAFKIFPKISFVVKTSGGSEMKVRKEVKPTMIVAGLTIQARPGQGDFSGLWDKLWQDGYGQQLAGMGTGQSFGACYNMQPDGTFTYMAGLDVAGEEAASALGLEVLHVPETEYTIFELHGPVPDCIHKGYAYVMGEYIPASGYKYAGVADFEVYSDGDMAAPDYQMELWMPLQKD